MMANTRKRDSHNKKCCNTSFLIKLPQLALSFVIMLLCRESLLFASDDFDVQASSHAEVVENILGTSVELTNYMPWGDPKSVDANIFGDVMAFGFFAVILAQTISAANGEIAFLQNALLILAGGVGYVVIGILHMVYYKDHKSVVKASAGSSFYAIMMSNGAFAITNGFLMLVDALFCVYNVAWNDFID